MINGIYDFIKQYGIYNFIKHYGIYQDDRCKSYDCWKLLPVYKREKGLEPGKDWVRLLILVYVNSKDKFYFDYLFQHISQMPKELIDLYDSSIYSVPKKEDLEAIGFIDYTQIAPIIKEYNKYSNYVIYHRYLEKIRNTNSSKTDEIVDTMNSFKQVLFDIANSKEGIIGTDSLDKILTFGKKIGIKK